MSKLFTKVSLNPSDLNSAEVKLNHIFNTNIVMKPIILTVELVLAFFVYIELQLLPLVTFLR